VEFEISANSTVSCRRSSSISSKEPPQDAVAWANSAVIECGTG
jgi:hypothetical protein